ncbi:hypothetical protein ACP4OV_005227 [Aristida adscensionis]
MAMEQGRGAGHLLLFPFLAQGHLIPFLNLARRIESLGQLRGGGRGAPAVTIVSTPRNVAGLWRAVPAGSSIGFAELPFSPSDHGLPPDAESADTISLMAFPVFFSATESLRLPFEKLLAELAGREGCKNVCVLADIFLGWTAESARDLGVQHRVFLTAGAYASAVVFSIWLHPPTFPRPVADDDEQPLPDFPDVRVRYVEFLNVIFSEDTANPMLAYLRRTLNLHFRHSGGGEWLPDGFEGRAAAAARGLVVRRWAPQVRILSLWHGVPVLGWPLMSDQLFDSRMLKELGVGVEVASGRMFGGLDTAEGWERVRDAVETVLGAGERARDMRRKAAELRKLVRAAVEAEGDDGAKGSSVLAMERLLDTAFC